MEVIVKTKNHTIEDPELNLVIYYRISSISLIPSFSLPNVLCDPTDLIWRKGTPFEAMTGRTPPSSDGLLAEDRKSVV